MSSIADRPLKSAATTAIQAIAVPIEIGQNQPVILCILI
jgi:hypothetical protein